VDVHGRATVRSCADIGEPVDVAFTMVPQAGTLDALTDAARAGIKNAVVLSSGYGEAGEAGRRAQAELVAHAESLDMVVLGPNHLGFANMVDQVPVTPVPGLPRDPAASACSRRAGPARVRWSISRRSRADVAPRHDQTRHRRGEWIRDR
jgi:acyl-CoA synthetase (NDP forming)